MTRDIPFLIGKGYFNIEQDRRRIPLSFSEVGRRIVGGEWRFPELSK